MTPNLDLSSMVLLSFCSLEERDSSNSEYVLCAREGVPLKKIIIHPAISKINPADDNIC